MKTIKIGIMPFADLQKMMIEKVKGNIKLKKDMPKVWFDSNESFAQLMSEKNMKLLRIIRNQKPSSMKELAELCDRSPASITRTIKSLEISGLVTVDRAKGKAVPKVIGDKYKLEFAL